MPISPTLLWLIIGVVFCLMELVLPTAFVESTLGISALIVALISLVLPQVNLQILLWMILSVIFIFLLRQFMPKRRPYAIEASTEARALTEIPAGKMGRVRYEGNSWQARCEDEALTIAVDQELYVVGRKGNTLMVLPQDVVR